MRNRGRWGAVLCIALLMLSCNVRQFCAGAENVGTPGGETKPPEDAALQARIRELIRQLGDDDYYKREAASSALRRIGRPALEPLRAATKDRDLERAERAARLVEKIAKLPDPSKVNPNATNGYMPVHQQLKQCQTFKVAEDTEIDAIRFRAARTYNIPITLTVELRDPAKEDEDEGLLASASFTYEWTDERGGVRGVTRFMHWFEFKAVAKLRKGKIYKLVFSSPDSGEDNPWLVNAFYRDTFPGGEHEQVEDGKAEVIGKFDLVFELRHKDQVKLTSVPEKVEFPKEQEHFGVGHDGTDLRKPEGEAPVQGGDT